MNEADKKNPLENLVLALIARRLTMPVLLASGYTAGQVVRVLLALQESRHIETVDGRTSLTDSGSRLLAGAPVSLPKNAWIAPKIGEKIEQVDINEAWLPELDELD